jgi:hypothetical protein
MNSAETTMYATNAHQPHEAVQLDVCRARIEPRRRHLLQRRQQLVAASNCLELLDEQLLEVGEEHAVVTLVEVRAATAARDRWLAPDVVPLVLAAEHAACPVRPPVVACPLLGHCQRPRKDDLRHAAHVRHAIAVREVAGISRELVVSSSGGGGSVGGGMQPIPCVTSASHHAGRRRQQERGPYCDQSLLHRVYCAPDPRR